MKVQKYPVNNHPIGIIDSGSGGLSIWQSIVSVLPGESTIYAGDHRYLPYGLKRNAFIRRRIIRIIRFLVSKKVKVVVIACNTATVAGIDYYRRTFPGLPIIGVVPVIKTAALLTKTGHIAVFSTTFTSRSAYQKMLIRDFASGKHVMNIGDGNLVPLLESRDFDEIRIRRLLNRYLGRLRATDTDVLALGCTHFPFLRNQIRDIVGDRITLLDSGGAVARHVVRILTNNNTLSGISRHRYTFYTSGEGAAESTVASRLMKQRIRFVHTDF